MRWLVLVCVAVALLVMANRAAAARPIDVTITPQPVTAYGVYTYVYSAYIGKDNGRMIGNGLFEVVP
jgi:hypothetical protein